MTNTKAAGKILGMMLFTAFLCMFVQFSFHFMLKSFATEVIGYEVHRVFEDGSSEELGFIDKSEKPANPENNMKYVSVFSEMPKSAKAVEVVLSTIFSLGILFCTAGSVLADIAAKDRNNCDFNGAKHNKNRGLVIGLISAVPLFALYLATLVLRFLPSSNAANWYFWFYRFIVLGPVKPINDVITNSATDLTKVSLSWTVFHIAYTVLFVLFCYLMYRICYNEDSVLAKLLYKSKRQDSNTRRLGGR